MLPLNRKLRWFDSTPPLKNIFWIVLSIFLTYELFHHYAFRRRSVFNSNVSSIIQIRKEIQIINVTHSSCDNETLLLEKCSQPTFVSSRTQKRTAADQNAVFLKADRVLDLGRNHFISVDDILFGYDLLFEKDALFSAGSWLGVQFQSSPTDAIVFQQLLWRIKPDLIIDLGTNVGGSALFFASIMSLYTDTGAIVTVDAKPFTENWLNKDRVLCKDCTNPADNPLWKKYVHFIQGLTIDAQTIEKVKRYVSNATTVFISHDASHIGHIVYQDLINFAPFVSINSYLVVQDTKLDRIFNSNTGPLDAVRKFLKYQNNTKNPVDYTFKVDRSVEIYYYSQHAYGWLKRVK